MKSLRECELDGDDAKKASARFAFMQCAVKAEEGTECAGLPAKRRLK
jgi:hypothetical protein